MLVSGPSRVAKGLDGWTMSRTGEALDTRVVIEQTLELASQHGREDLVDSLRRSLRRQESSDLRVLVVGQFKQGKSQLVNATLNAPICPVDDDIATSVPMEVAYGDPPSATLFLSTDRAGVTDSDDVVTRDIPIDDLARFVGRETGEVDGRQVVGARARLPRRLLQSGIVFVDTPGTGGAGSVHTVRTVAALQTADAVLFVSDASSEFTAPELAFLRQALTACPTVICVLTKTDLFPDWRRVLELDTRHLREAGLDLTILPVSATMRLAAATSTDADLNEASGFVRLMSEFGSRVVGRRAQLLRASTRHDVTLALDAVSMSLKTEHEALADPDSVPALTASLTATGQRADDLKRRSARWQTTLSDGVADLVSDLDYDLRDRVRRVVRESEEAIDEGDPGEAWAEFAGWVEGRCADAVSATFRWADDNAAWLVEQVGQHFAEEARASFPSFELAESGGVAGAVPSVGALDEGHLNLAQKVFIGMRGSYGGVLMTGLMTGIAGLALVNPISLGAGFILGTKAYREDAEQRLRRRRSEAKALVRRYADDVVFYIGKQLRDRLRDIQRTVREHYTGAAEAMSRSLATSVKQARSAAEASVAERRDRLEVVGAALKEIETVRQAAIGLDPGRADPRVKPPLPRPATRAPQQDPL